MKKKTVSVISAGVTVLLILTGVFFLMKNRQEENEAAAEEEPVAEKALVLQEEAALQEALDKGNAVSMEEFAYSITEGGDGLIFEYTNGSDHTVWGFEIDYEVRYDAQQSELNDAFSYFLDAEWLEVSEGDLWSITLITYDGRVVEPGETDSGGTCTLSNGIEAESMEQISLMKAKTAYIRYIDGDAMYLVTYDFDSDTYEIEKEDDDIHETLSPPFSNIIPEIDADITEVVTDTYENAELRAYGLTYEEFRAYIEKCTQDGFTVVDYDEETAYRAIDPDGYYIYLLYTEEYEETYIYSGTMTSKDLLYMSSDAEEGIEDESEEETEIAE